MNDSSPDKVNVLYDEQKLPAFNEFIPNIQPEVTEDSSESITSLSPTVKVVRNTTPSQDSDNLISQLVVEGDMDKYTVEARRIQDVVNENINAVHKVDTISDENPESAPNGS
jgi:hypothetical protein